MLGTCGKFEEKQLGSERFNLFTGCPGTKSCTIVLRGGADQYIDEAERSLNDAIMIVRRAIKANSVVAGGGAIEMELSRHLREYLRGISGKTQLVVNAFAKALEIIPRQLADNSGMDSTDVLNKLRQKHTQDAEDGTWFGVDVINQRIANMYKLFVWEPELVRVNVISAATEAACTILSVDQTIKNPNSEQQQTEAEKRMAGNYPRQPRPQMGRGIRGRGGK